MRISHIKAGLLLAALTAISFGSVNAQTSLKLGYSLAPNSHYGVGATAMAEELERPSDGAFTVEQHFGLIMAINLALGMITPPLGSTSSLRARWPMCRWNAS